MSDKTASRCTFQILGGGLIGWSVATILARQMGRHGHVAITPCDIPTDIFPVVVDSQSPLLALSGLDPFELVKEARGGFWLATRFHTWGPGGRDAFYAPSEAMPSRAGVADHQLLRRLSATEPTAENFAPRWQQLNFQALLAASGKFASPADERASPRSLLRPAIMVDGAILAEMMERTARDANVEVRSEPFASDMATLTIDCRPDAPEKNGDWMDLRPSLGANRRLAARVAPVRQMDHPAYDNIVPTEAGLLHFAPLRGGGIATLYFDGASISDKKAEATITGVLSGYRLEQLAVDPWRPGFISDPWQGSILKLGPSAAVLGTALGGDIGLLSAQIERLIELLPDRTGSDLSSKALAYNNRIAAVFGHWRDLVQLPLIRNGLAGNRWAALRAQAVSPALARRLNLFERRGHLVMLDYDIHETSVWLDLMVGMGVTPISYDRVADGVDLHTGMAGLGQAVMAFKQTIEKLPSHHAFLTRMLAEGAA